MQVQGTSYTHKDMTKTINIKAIIIAFIMAAIVLLALATRCSSVAHTNVQTWQADTSWISGWNR